MRWKRPDIPRPFKGTWTLCRKQLELTYSTPVWYPLAVFYLAAAIFRECRPPTPHRGKHWCVSCSHGRTIHPSIEWCRGHTTPPILPVRSLALSRRGYTLSGVVNTWQVLPRRDWCNACRSRVLGWVAHLATKDVWVRARTAQGDARRWYGRDLGTCSCAQTLAHPRNWNWFALSPSFRTRKFSEMMDNELWQNCSD